LFFTNNEGSESVMIQPVGEMLLFRLLVRSNCDRAYILVFAGSWCWCLKKKL